ncbi:MAG: hypothetical protein LBH75_08400 [Treponema sp.]|jgi:DNA adenine methylase|nr:hypothetical protein [Treponema sp.]
MQYDFNTLLQTLERLKGKFLLSSLRNAALSDFTMRNGWHTLDFVVVYSMSKNGGTRCNKGEALTANYPIHVKSTQNSLRVLSHLVAEMDG